MMPFAKMKLEATHVNVQAVMVMESAKGLKNSIIKLLCWDNFLTSSSNLFISLINYQW